MGWSGEYARGGNRPSASGEFPPRRRVRPRPGSDGWESLSLSFQSAELRQATVSGYRGIQDPALEGQLAAVAGRHRGRRRTYQWTGPLWIAVLRPGRRCTEPLFLRAGNARSWPSSSSSSFGYPVPSGYCCCYPAPAGWPARQILRAACRGSVHRLVGEDVNRCCRQAPSGSSTVSRADFHGTVNFSTPLYPTLRNRSI